MVKHELGSQFIHKALDSLHVNNFHTVNFEQLLNLYFNSSNKMTVENNKSIARESKHFIPQSYGLRTSAPKSPDQNHWECSPITMNTA